MDSRDFLLEECQQVPLPAAPTECQTSSPTGEEPFDPVKLVEPPARKKLMAKNWFLTFPRTETTRQQALDQLLARYKDALKGVLIAQEQHKDGE